jgi:tRNA-specific 2-thiouridylase
MKDKVMVSLNGSVESKASAKLMLERGYEVYGVTLQLFDCQENVIEESRECAKQLGIEWHVSDYRKFFGEDVSSYYIRNSKQGLSPNACCHCNFNAKFNYLHREMLANNCKKLVTGDYARVIEVNGEFRIAKALSSYDRSYYLSLMEQYQLDTVYFPLGELTDDEIKDLFQRYELQEPTSNKHICFLNGKSPIEYLESKLKETDIRKGDFIFEGKVQKQHDGTIYFTEGQRKGIEVSHTEALYVKSINGKTGDIELGTKEQLYTKGIKLRDCIFTDKSSYIRRAKIKTSANAPEVECIFEIHPEGRGVVLFNEPQFAPAIGQIVALYDGELVIGGGSINSIF